MKEAVYGVKQLFQSFPPLILSLFSPSLFFPLVQAPPEQVLRQLRYFSISSSTSESNLPNNLRGRAKYAQVAWVLKPNPLTDSVAVWARSYGSCCGEYAKQKYCFLLPTISCDGGKIV